MLGPLLMMGACGGASDPIVAFPADSSGLPVSMNVASGDVVLAWGIYRSGGIGGEPSPSPGGTATYTGAWSRVGANYRIDSDGTSDGNSTLWSNTVDSGGTVTFSGSSGEWWAIVKLPGATGTFATNGASSGASSPQVCSASAGAATISGRTLFLVAVCLTGTPVTLTATGTSLRAIDQVDWYTNIVYDVYQGAFVSSSYLTSPSVTVTSSGIGAGGWRVWAVETPV